MAAYVISEIEILDSVLIEDYRRLARETIAQYGGRYIGRGGAIEPVEGGWAPKTIVIVEFPTMERAKEWYRSPEYAEALKLRHTALDRKLIFVEGVAPSTAVRDQANRVPMEIEIKRLKIGDESVFDNIAEEVFDEPVDRKRLVAYLREPGHHMIAALHDGMVVGQCAAVVHRHPDKPTELYIDEVGVTPALHRKGIARRMLDEMFALGKTLGCEEAWVGTEPDNRPARRLYEARGGEAETFVMYLYKL